MPKRKNTSSLEKDLDHLMRKMKKLERKIRRNKNNDILSSDDDYEDKSTTRNSTLRSVVLQQESSPLLLGPDDWLTIPPEEVQPENINIPSEDADETHQALSHPGDIESIAKNNHGSEQDSTQEAPGPSNVDPQDLECDILEILGDDPSSSNTYGSDIRKEIALRLQHIAQDGIVKDLKKELINKYPLPANCLFIGAPMLNPEIKAALPELAIKRDKGIEIKQKQMASAISCLCQILSTQLNSNQKDNELLQKLMDMSRLLCDIQHSDSTTRRNFILSALKKDMKEHLTNTKIDTFLFGDKLAETIKSAKAVNKSGVELKPDSGGTKNLPRRTNTPVSRPLNRRAPALARRQPATGARSRQPATPRAQHPLMPPAHSLRTSWPLPPPPPPPPPPPAQQTRRRY